MHHSNQPLFVPLIFRNPYDMSNFAKRCILPWRFPQIQPHKNCAIYYDWDVKPKQPVHGILNGWVACVALLEDGNPSPGYVLQP